MSTSIKSAMADITYFVESKRKYRDVLSAKGKDVSGISAEIATMEAIREYVDYLEQENDHLFERAEKAERMAAESSRSIRTAIAVQDARQWAIVNGKIGFAKLLTMIERNPDYFSLVLGTLGAFDDQYFFMLKVLEKRYSPYDAKAIELYRSFCAFAGISADKRIQEWRAFYDKNRERMDLDSWLESRAKDEMFLKKLYELIPGLANIEKKS